MAGPPPEQTQAQRVVLAKYGEGIEDAYLRVSSRGCFWSGRKGVGIGMESSYKV